MRRLYRQFYLAIVASLVLVVLFGGALWRFAPGQPRSEEPFEMAGEMVATLLPPADQSAAVQQEAIDRLHARSKIDLALFDRDLRRIAEAGRPLPKPRREKAWLALWPRRPGLGDPAARRALDRRPRAGPARAAGARHQSRSSAASRLPWRSAPIRWCGG